MLPMPHFCQDGPRDFLKIDEKIGGGGEGVVANLQRIRGRGHKNLMYETHFYSPGHAPDCKPGKYRLPSY